MKLFKYDNVNMRYRPLFGNKVRMMSWLVIIPLIILLLIFQIGYMVGGNGEYFSLIKKDNVEYEKELFIIDTIDVFSEENLVNYLLSSNIKFPDIVFSQARYESGNFKSLIFNENNNLFGMKVANSRATTNMGEQYNHAIFNSWQMSVLDYALWQNAYARKFKTRNEYIQYLKNVYAEGTYKSIYKILLETQKKYPQLKVTYPFRG